MTRVWTALGLITVLAVAVGFGGWVFSVLFVMAMCMCTYEFYQVLKSSGKNTIQWPVWMCVALSAPLFVIWKDNDHSALLALLVTIACFASCVNVVFRKKASLDDMIFSCVPLYSVMLPGFCMLSFLQAEGKLLQTLLILESFGIALMGDTFALYIGKRYGRHKLCPGVSPNKTVEGALGSLVGSVFFATVCAYVCSFFGDIRQPIWHFALLGIVGGFAGQIGDLFASLVKRYCKVKDFSNIFPGHGGMMDRLDSVFFTTVAVYVYYLCIF